MQTVSFKRQSLHCSFAVDEHRKWGSIFEFLLVSFAFRKQRVVLHVFRSILRQTVAFK